MPPDAGAAIAATIIAKKRRKILEAFRLATAISATNGKTLAELGITGSNIFKILVPRKVIVRMQDERYYLDEVRLQEVDRLKRRIAAIPIIAFIIFLLILLLTR